MTRRITPPVWGWPRRLDPPNGCRGLEDTEATSTKPPFHSKELSRQPEHSSGSRAAESMRSFSAPERQRGSVTSFSAGAKFLHRLQNRLRHNTARSLPSRPVHRL